MWALKSPRKALEHTRGVQMGPACELCKDFHYFWTQEMPTGWVLGPSKDRTRQSDLRVGSAFHKEYLSLQDLDRKSTKMWIEVAFDLLRVQRGGLKWPSTSWEWTKGVQHAKYARITTIYWTQERSPRSRTSRKCTHMNRSGCKIGPHGPRFYVPNWGQNDEELLVLI